MKLVLISLFTVITLSACTVNKGRYQQKHDSTPVRTPTSAELHDAIPRVEKPSRGGNKNYTVFGKHYQVIKSAENFEQTGIASWYGSKFHGHLTSNGEIYDMYAMSAAHKNLPLPTYLKVTNLANNKSTIVRVNDRGPFHQDRIIDLSYSAAYKLGMLKTGTAKVHIETITQAPKSNSPKAKPPIAQTPQVQEKLPSGPEPIINANKKLESAVNAGSPPVKAGQLPANNLPLNNLPANKKPYYIQVFATKNLASAKATSEKLSGHLAHQLTYPYSNGIFRVFVGPIVQLSEQQALLEQLKKLGYPNAYVKEKIN
ncbi:septal ring lytic transglycosylase RlpA family protein [Thalassotalea sp. PLHSN55]|uniref:septal ring lytic transglycosylase RlpA family protein n=1 Tax=Thalassotalea sp. PLHSN55 TaxID=3435888 RepID=UPI003F8421E4